MKSSFAALQCPCGCELAAEHRLEVLYRRLVEAGFEVEGMVNCAEGCNSMLRLRNEHLIPDKMSKLVRDIQRDVCFKMEIVYDQSDMYWYFDVAAKSGVLFA